jgi:hypothetical protein
MKLANSLRSFDKWIIAIFILSLSLQIGLGIVNREANDDHIEVVNRILLNEPLEKESCVQCYHPKFYHYTIAQIGDTTGRVDEESLTIIGQLINVFAGAILLIFIWLFISKLPYENVLKRIAFALVAFNPELISSNIQATNNTFVILFSTISIYYLFKFLKEKNLNYYIIFTLSTVLAALSKGPGVVIFMGIFTVLFLQTISLWKDRRDFIKNIILITTFSFVFLSLVGYFGPYYSHWKKYGDPFVGNWGESQSLNWIQKTYVKRPGLTSVLDGFFTFRYVDLLKKPLLTTNGETNYPDYRTSFWTLLFARTFSIHFPEWPASWVNYSKDLVFITRGIYVLAILPTSLFIIGLLKSIKNIWKDFIKDKLSYFINHREWIFLVFLTLLIAMMAKWGIKIRDFSAIKMLYIYPGILCFVYYFLLGSDVVFRKVKDKLILKKVLIIWLVFFALSFYDVLYLFAQLVE